MTKWKMENKWRKAKKHINKLIWKSRKKFIHINIFKKLNKLMKNDENNKKKWIKNNK